MLLEISGEITPERMKRQTQSKNNAQLLMWLVMEVQCCKEHYCIGTWNVRSMNQDKLEVVKQEMARVNVDILGISEHKWTGMGEFNSDDHYIYYCGQESLRKKWTSTQSQQESKMQFLGAISKMTEWSLFISKANHSMHGNPSLCPNQ